MPIFEVHVSGSYVVNESQTFTVEAKNEEEAKDLAADQLCDYYGEDFDNIECEIENEYPTEEEKEQELLNLGYTPRCKFTKDMFD